MTSNPQHTVQDEVLERIRSGNLRMKPRFFFVLKLGLILFIAALIAVVSIFLVSFISFAIRLNGHDSLLGFGSRGFFLFLELFPWFWLLLDLVLIVLLGWILRRFKFAYRRSLLLVLVVLSIIAGAVGIVFDHGTRFHDDRLDEAERGELFMPFESLYERVHTRAPAEFGVYRGFVVRIAETDFSITYDDGDGDFDDGMWRIVPPDDFEVEELFIGDRVYVAGDEDGDVIRAYGVHILDR